MGRRTIFILAGLAAALSVVALVLVVVAFLNHPSGTANARAIADPPPATTVAAAAPLAANNAPVAAETAVTTAAAAAPPATGTQAQATPPAALPPAPPPAGAPAAAPPAAVPAVAASAAFRAVLEEAPAKTGDPELKFAGSTIWTLADGGADGQVVEARATIPDRRWSVAVRLKKNSDATFPASHLIEINVAGPPGQPSPVGKVLAFRFKTSEEASPELVTNASQKIVDGVFWVALSDDPKNPKLPSLFRLPWLDILVEYPAGQRAVLSLEKGEEGKRVMDAALAAWNAAPGR